MGMPNRNDVNHLDASLFDPDHDLDLVAMLNNARTHDEVRQAMRLSRNRMRVRAAALQGAAAPRRGFGVARLARLATPSLRRS
jgi:hypothetical protein